jgi:type I restriction enzyme S subunit
LKEIFFRKIVHNYAHQLIPNQIIEDIEFRFSILDSIEKGIDKSILQAERLHQAILRKAFTGGLVPQNPEDEPVVVLL